MSRLFLLMIFISTQVFAQKNTSIYYEQYENNQLQENRNIEILTDNNTCAIVNSTTTERFYIDYTKKQTIKTADLNKINYVVYTFFDSLSQATKTNDTATILGFLCKKITFNVFSNRYEVWYTEQANTNASPSISFAPPKGAVLKITINGNRTILAKSFSASEKKINFVASEYTKISEPKYVATQIKSRYAVLPVFEKEQINFDNDLKTIDAIETNKTYRFCKGNIILKKITLPKNSEKGLFYAKLTDWSNGDAYDRVGSVFTFSTKNDINILKALEQGTNILPIYVDNKKENYQGIVCTKEYTPAIELMRFFTPFGVGHFNTKRIIDGYEWANEANYKAEITSLIPSDENEIWIGIYIGNYDKGGHKVSLEIDFYPEPEMETYKKTILPLFNTVNIMEACGQNYGRLFEHDTLIVSFEITDSIKDAQLLFTSTGHGGWGGGDEFNPKSNQVFIDGKEVFHYAPWRNDCATYRLLNPSSGNFPDGLSSSDLSRSNWCPGTLTPPYYISLKNLNPGLHTLKIAINQGTNEGGSFSHWCTSGVIVGVSK